MLPCRFTRLSSVLALLSVLLLLVCGASHALPPVHAATVWSDNFDDGNYNGWTVQWGAFSAASHRLAPVYNGTTTCITHPSTVVTGTWRFDWHISTTPYSLGDLAVTFIARVSIQPCVAPVAGYCVSAGRRQPETLPAEASLALCKWSGGEFDPVASGPSLPVDSEGRIELSMHIDVTRTAAGDIHLWMNGTHQCQYHDAILPCNNSTHLMVHTFWGLEYLTWVDNVVVSNTVDIEPPTTTTTTTTTTGIPGFTLPAITLGLLVALTTALVYRRRRP